MIVYGHEVLTLDDDFDGASGSGLGGLEGLHRFFQLEPKTIFFLVF
jgi:hypothetical protein